MNRIDRDAQRPVLLAASVSLVCGAWAAGAGAYASEGSATPMAVVVAGQTSSAAGQGTADRSERSPRAQGRLDEILVTARRRTESLFDVPVAVSAFSSQLIGDLNLENINDIARYTPGFSFNSAFGRQEDRPVIRGVGSILNGIAGIGSAATFVDGVFVGGSVTSTELLNVERVEIIKGPQAAQFGRGTYAGAINYVTRRPSNEFEGEVQVGVAQHSTLEGSAWLSGPILEDRLYYYVAGGWDEYGGEYRNTVTGRKVGDTQTRSFSGRLLYTPNDDVDVSLRLGYNRQDDGHPALWMQGRDQNNCCFRGPDRPRAREYFIGTAQTGNDVTLATDLFDDLGGAGLFRERWLGSLTIDWRLPNDMVFQSITGIVDDDNGSNLDVSYTANDVLFNPGLPPFLQPILAGNFFSSREFRQEDFSQEFRLSSSQEQPLRWTAGVYYYEGERRDTRFDKVIPANTGVIGNPENIVTNVAPFRFEDIENRAVFAGVEWDATERLTLSLEARYAEDDVTLANRDPETGAEVNRFNDTFKSFTPRATALYRLTEDWNVYANVARGTRPGTFNPQVPAGPDGEPDESLRAVDEEVSLTYELGTRANILDGRGSVVAAGYFTTLRDQQTSRIIVLPTGQTAASLSNVGKTDIWGVELEVGLQLTERWTANLSWAYTHAEIKRQIDQDQADLLGSDGSFEDIQQFGSVAGQRPPRVPRNEGALRTRYQAPFAVNPQVSWFVGGDVTFEGSRYAEVHNLIRTGHNTYVGAQLGLEGERWRLTAWARNLFDDDNAVDIFRFIDTRFGTLPPQPEAAVQGAGTPRGFPITLPRGRQLGLTATFSF